LQKLTLKDQSLFNRYLTLQGHELAVFSFANIYIWRSLYDIRWQIIEDSLCIFFKDKIGVFMYLPALGKDRNPKVIEEAFAVMDKINKNQDISRIENIESADLGYYRALGYLAYEKYPDYFCLGSDLANLCGNKFKSARASYNYFIKHYDFNWRKLELTDRAEVFRLFVFWEKQRRSKNSDDIYRGMLADNRRVINCALDNYKKLNLTGIVVEVNKEIKAFSFGYALNSDTFCILYEITDLAVKGLAQFIFRQFAQTLKNYKYINIMDDSGLENLRKTKLSYKPVRLIPAYILKRNA
jgi:uncharacterized protein